VDLTLIVFVMVYVAMGLGHVPGFKVDRAGAALIGAIVLVVSGKMSSQAAWNSINTETIGLLFGLMVVSAAFVVSGFYAWTAERVAMLQVAPSMLLAILVAVSGLLSAVLTNDVVVIAMTPLLVKLSLARGLNPVPFLLGFCFAANTGSSGTIIGSPQNMIVAQGLGLSFNGFMAAAAIPALLSLPIVWAVIAFLYRHNWHIAARPEQPAPADAPSAVVAFNREETAKAAIVTLAVVLAFIFSDWPRELIALAGAGLLLMNRRIASTDMMKHVDGSLLLMLMGLFVVNSALSATHLPQELLADLRGRGLNLDEPIPLFVASSVLSNLVGNSPSVMLLVPFLDAGGNAEALGAALALGTGFSSNFILFGSLAGIIVVEEAAASGIKISFAEFTRAGVPAALCCSILAVIWLMAL